MAQLDDRGGYGQPLLRMTDVTNVDPNDVPEETETNQVMSARFYERASFKGHNAAVTSLAVSQDGNILVSGSRDKSALVWDLPKTNENWAVEQTRLLGHNHFVSGVSLSQDASYLLSSSWDKTLRLWQLANRTCKTKFLDHEKDVLAVQFSSDNRRIISCGRDNTVRIWNILGKCVYTLGKFDSWVTSVACAPLADENQPFVFAAGFWDGSVKAWKVENDCKELYTIQQAHEGRCHSLSFTPDGQWLITGGSDRKVVMWSAENGAKMLSFTASAVINYVCACPTRAWITAATYEGIHVWDISDKQQIDLVDIAFKPLGKRNAGRKPDCTTLAWADDGAILYAGYNDGVIKAWEVRSEQ